jgi:beta-aspartyl-peptidase (threonine type)
MKPQRQIPAIIIHGGAWDIPRSVRRAHVEGVKAAAARGMEVLGQGGTAVRAVIEAVKVLEANPTFDAGRGSFLNAAGQVELDAIVMDGRDLSVGAVAAVQNVLHPVELADLVRTRSPHCFLVGRGAADFARFCGMRVCSPEELLVGREKQRYLRLKKRKKKKFRIRPMFEGRVRKGSFPSDTVGAVAFDRLGGTAAATSTGGVPNKLPGRVGDSPLVGAGAYADRRSGGASSTGLGESILKVLMAKTAVDLMGEGWTASRAAREAVRRLQRRVDGLGGVITIDGRGRCGYAYNTPFMARAVAGPEGIREADV